MEVLYSRWPCSQCLTAICDGFVTELIRGIRLFRSAMDTDELHDEPVDIVGDAEDEAIPDIHFDVLEPELDAGALTPSSAADGVITDLDAATRSLAAAAPESTKVSTVGHCRLSMCGNHHSSLASTETSKGLCRQTACKAKGEGR